MAKQEEPRSVEQEFTFRKVRLLKNETLGTGSYGAVCKAKCDQLICAAKLLYPVLFQMQAPDPGKEHRQPFRRFELECQFLSRVNHPNIVQYLGTYRDPETNAPVLLMELMDESLTHFLESSPGDIPYHIQVNLSQDIAQALAFLHANGIIHRDLSSNNVLLIAGSRAKVSDFGMSKFTDINTTRLATMTTCPGTPAFMSPEALDEPPAYTDKLDTFSFGVLLVQISTRQFPEPTDRFEKIDMPNPRNPSHKIKVRAPILEVERRQAHISLIKPTHPLLPIALECLNNEAVERPSSQLLCQSLKRTVIYQESLKQNMVDHLKKQIRKKDMQIRAKDCDLLEKDQLIRAKDKSLLEKDQLLGAKDRDLQVIKQEKDQQGQDLQSLQHEVEAKEHQLRRLHQQLESNEEITATLQHAITHRDREIAELRGLQASKDIELPSRSQFNRQATPNSDELRMSWEILPKAFEVSMEEDIVSAVVGEKAYFSNGMSVWEFNSSSSQWKILPEHPLLNFSLVNIENELTTVGGGFKVNWLSSDSNKLYSYIEGKWVGKYPPMTTKRYSCAAVYTNPILIVIGKNHNTVEILNIHSKKWSKVSSLPFSSQHTSLILCGEYMYLQDVVSFVRCSLFSLALSIPKTNIWEDIAPLPVVNSTLVAVKGQLLAVGGKTTWVNGVRCKEVHQYNPTTNTWQIISQTNIPRCECAVALLSSNKLMVLGGLPIEEKQLIEVATFL